MSLTSRPVSSLDTLPWAFVRLRSLAILALSITSFSLASCGGSAKPPVASASITGFAEPCVFGTLNKPVDIDVVATRGTNPMTLDSALTNGPGTVAHDWIVANASNHWRPTYELDVRPGVYGVSSFDGRNVAPLPIVTKLVRVGGEATVQDLPSSCPLTGATAGGTSPSTTQPLPPCLSGGSSVMPPGALSCRMTGIFPNAQASEVFGWTFEVTNTYSGSFNGQTITVDAGAALSPDPTGRTAHGTPDGGGVRVIVGSGTDGPQFLLAGTLGPLSIQSVSGGIVTLQRQDGTTVTFNLATDTYS